jgi:HK97 family phage major capsid protein
MNLSEMIKLAQAQLMVKADEKSAIVAKGMEMTDAEVARGTALAGEIKSLEARLTLLKEQEATEAAAATAVVAKGLEIPATAKIEVKPNAPKGSAFTRVAMVMARAKGNLAIAKSLAEDHFKDDAIVTGIVKAAASAGTTTVAQWAGNLIYPEQYAGDFIEMLYPQTILGRLNLRKIPFNVRVSSQISGTSVGWVGEATPAPVTAAGFDSVKLGWNKVAALAVFSDELIKFSSPAAEALVQADLLKATAQGLDRSFLSSAAAVADVSPAGVLNGVTGIAAGGTDALALIADVQKVVGPFIAANIDLSRATFAMSPARALAIGSMRNALGAKYFPDMTVNGGVLENFPVLTSNNIPGDKIVFLVPDEIYLSEDAGPQIESSTEASILMSTTPVADAATAQLVSMFQSGMVAVKIGQFINWQARRPGLCASLITGAAYA